MRTSLDHRRGAGIGEGNLIMDLMNISPGLVTMSSREIAELSDKQHKHVLPDIEKIFGELGGPKSGTSSFGAAENDLLKFEAAEISQSKFGSVETSAPKSGAAEISQPKFGPSEFEAEYITEQNKTAKEYHLPKDLTVTLITEYRADLRYQVVKRP
jgi:phage regulator Rha-like protein